MKTNYEGHDQLYVDYRAGGKPGWDTQEDVQQLVAYLASLFEGPLIPRSGRVIDLGCGAGNYSVWLAQRGYQVDGIDIAPTAIDWAKERALAEGVDVDFQVGSVLTLDGFADERFDVALDWHCFHCVIGDDRERFLESVHRVLKPGGVFVSHTMCGDRLPSDERFDFDSVTRTVIYSGIHIRYMGWPEDVLAEIRRVGLDVLYSKIETDHESDMLLTIATKPG